MPTVQDHIDHNNQAPARGTRVQINTRARKVRRGDIPAYAEGEIESYTIGIRLRNGERVWVMPSSLELAEKHIALKGEIRTGQPVLSGTLTVTPPCDVAIVDSDVPRFLLAILRLKKKVLKTQDGEQTELTQDAPPDNEMLQLNITDFDLTDLPTDFMV